MAEGDAEILKAGVVDFVAISYYMTHVTEARPDASKLAGSFVAITSLYQ